MSASKASAAQDVAADTVIGFVLVTGISILMISVVMLMGAPALEQVQSRQQMDSMIGSYQRLDRGVSTLLSGSPAGTTPSWQVSMASGSLSLDQGGDQLWGYAVDFHRNGEDYKFWFGDYSDGDDQLVIRNTGPSVGAGEFEVEISRWEADERVAGPHETDTTNFPADSEYTLDDSQFSSGNPMWHLAENTTQIKLFDRGNPDGKQRVGEVWFIDGGAVEWKLARSGQMMRLFYQNTGILADIDDGQVLHNTPRLRAPDTSGSEEDVFIRIVKLEGALAAGGRTTSNVLLSSEGNHGRFSSGNVTQVQIYPPVSMIEAWHRHLTNEAAGFSYDWSDGSDNPRPFVGDEAAANFTASGEEASTTLVETTVTISRSGGS